MALGAGTVKVCVESGRMVGDEPGVAVVRPTDAAEGEAVAGEPVQAARIRTQHNKRKSKKDFWDNPMQ